MPQAFYNIVPQAGSSQQLSLTLCRKLEARSNFQPTNGFRFSIRLCKRPRLHHGKKTFVRVSIRLMFTKKFLKLEMEIKTCLRRNFDRKMAHKIHYLE
jgi:hypothetical protein